MKEPKGITKSEWLKELENLSALKSDEGMTVREIRNALGIGIDRVYDWLHNAIDAGKVTTGKRIINRMGDNARQAVPVYQWRSNGKSI